MKQPIVVRLLVHLLSRLIPLEDSINLLVHKAARLKIAQEAKAAIAAADEEAYKALRWARQEAEFLQTLAREEAAGRHLAITRAVPALTPEGASALVSVAINSAIPQSPASVPTTITLAAPATA